MPLQRSSLLRSLYERWPAVQPLMLRVNALIRKAPPVRFSGWRMTTAHQVPWIEGWGHFLKAAAELHSFERSDVPSSPKDTDALMWRHWNVAFTVHHVVVHTGPSRFIGVECGTADGYTAHIALSQMRVEGNPYEAHLYDAWAGMRSGPYEGAYASLSQDTTRRNLASHAANIEWHRGYIPETLDHTAPESVHWLHIDLNAAPATLAALEFFWPRIPNGGVALFDDYGWVPDDSTRRAVNEFLRNRPGTLLPLPTGQAIYFR